MLRPEHIAGVPFRMLPPAGRAYVSGNLLHQAEEGVIQSRPTQLQVCTKPNPNPNPNPECMNNMFQGAVSFNQTLRPRRSSSSRTPSCPTRPAPG